jgi:chaperonin GroES
MSQSKKSPKNTIPEVRPLADRVVVRPIDEGDQMKGGLHIPDTAKEKPQKGEVVAVGPGGMEKGERVPMDLEVGQKVLYAKYSGSEVTVDDQKLLIVKESDVLAIIG